MTVLDRFLKYIKINTQSDPNKTKVPTTVRQLLLARELVQELSDLNVDEVYFDDKNCYVYAKVYGDKDLPKIGFVSHLDTSPDVSSENIKPNIIDNYDGQDIKLNKDIILTVKENKDLKNHIGKTIITTDGKTLLGADDKAGIAEIMQMIERIKNEEINHGDIIVCFTPDEEIGLGISKLNYKIFNPDFAYTVDGSDVGEISYENFNAATATIEIKGNPTHTGDAKGKMINAVRVANLINYYLPNEIPENTEWYRGFYHLEELTGDVSFAKMKYLIRDFDKERFNIRKDRLKNVVKVLNGEYNNSIKLDIKDTYYNMNDIVKENMEIIENTKEAIRKENIKPLTKPIRGGTDGAEITYNGIVCPNLGTGGHNFHSIYEYVTVEDMEKVVDILISIVKQFSKERTLKK